jgi:DNA-binding MarR family transcriptional regulator
VALSSQFGNREKLLPISGRISPRGCANLKLIGESMPDTRYLAEAIWPAINIEMMQSQAWSICFTGEFRHDHYRQIVHVVFLRATTSVPCVLGELRREVADAFQIDEKTVASRIEKMNKKGGLLHISDDLTDRRKRLVSPTDKLIAAYTRYSDHLVDLHPEFRAQLDKRDRPHRIHKPERRFYFDLLNHIEPSADMGGSARPTIPISESMPIQPPKVRR